VSIRQPLFIQFSISHTTRKPREGEKDGVHYNFTTVDEIKKEIEAGKFVEYAEVHGNYYGTSVAAVQTVQEQGKICLLDIDIQGAQNVKKSDLDALYIFIAPPSMEELERRLRGRGTESEDAIVRRLGNAKAEMDYGAGEGNFDCVLV
jgi:guanylate kinase